MRVRAPRGSMNAEAQAELREALQAGVTSLCDRAGPDLAQRFFRAANHSRPAVQGIWAGMMDEIVALPDCERATYIAEMPNTRGPGRAETWGEAHYRRIDTYVSQGHTPTTAVRMIAREDGLTLAGEALKIFADARVKAWRKSSPERKRQK